MAARDRKTPSIKWKINKNNIEALTGEMSKTMSAFLI